MWNYCFMCNISVNQWGIYHVFFFCKWSQLNEIPIIVGLQEAMEVHPLRSETDFVFVRSCRPVAADGDKGDHTFKTRLLCCVSTVVSWNSCPRVVNEGPSTSINHPKASKELTQMDMGWNLGYQWNHKLDDAEHSMIFDSSIDSW